MNRMKIMVFFTSYLDMPARDGRDAMQGVSVEYLFFGENGEMVESKVSPDGNCGTRRGKGFLRDASAVNKVSYVPGIYEGTFEMTVGSDGKPVLKLTDIDFVTRAQLTAQPVKENGKGDGK